MTGECAGKIALVTGAAAGIGRASAVALARAGARVMAVDIANCDATVAQITAAGVQPAIAATDAMELPLSSTSLEAGPPVTNGIATVAHGIE